MILRGIATKTKTEAGIELQWDANRDPTQKLVVSVEFNTPKYRTYDGKLLVSYPDRAFSGIFDVSAVGPEYKGYTRLAWSPIEAVDIKFSTGAKTDDIKDIWLWLVLDTPFDGWRHNLIDTGIYHENNLLKVNASFLWAENQKLGFEFMGDYAIEDQLFRCEVKTAINSTVKDIPPVSGHFKHQNTEKKTDTEASFKYVGLNGTQSFYLRSEWEYDRRNDLRHISGSVAFKSPFEKFTKGAMVSRIAFSDRKEINAAADLEVEDRRYTLVSEGYLKKITDCWLVTNITTPNEKFRTIIARFGINEKERHAVAEISAPIGALGAEVLFYVVSSNNFNVKLSVATPLDAFSKLMIVGKINQETVDLRGSWNNVTMGFTGVWRMESLQDFEYSYRVYTPIELLEYNKVVVKFVQISPTNIDMDMSLKLANYKLGLTVFVQPNPKLIQALGKQKSQNMNKFLFDEDFLSNILTSEEIDEMESIESTEEEDDEEDFDDLINFSGHFNLDMIVYPSIHGLLDVEQIDDINYLVSATVNLPQGAVEIRDRLFYYSKTKLKNRLSIISPLPYAKEVKSNVLLKADLGDKETLATYLTGFDVSVNNQDEWIDVGLLVNLTKPPKIYRHRLKKYNLGVRVTTPLKGLPFVDFNGLVEIENKSYHGNISVETQTTRFSYGGNHKSDANKFNFDMILVLAAPLMPQYYHKIYLEKSMRNDKSVDFKVGFLNDDNGLVSELSVDGEWKLVVTEGKKELRARTKLHSNILPVKSIQGYINFLSDSLNKKTIADFQVIYLDTENSLDEILAKMERDKNKLRVTFVLPITEYRNITLNGILAPTDPSTPNTYKLVGNFNKNSQIYTLDGTMSIVNDIPVMASLEYRPDTGGEKTGVISYSLQENQNKYDLHAKVMTGKKFGEIFGQLGAEDQYNWGYKFTSKCSDPTMNNLALEISAVSEETDKITHNFEIKTPWKELGLDHLRLGAEANIDPKQGWLHTIYELPKLIGKTDLTWSWLLMEDMKILLDSQTSYQNGAKKSLITGVSYQDLENSTNVITTGDIHVNDKWNLKANATFTTPSLREKIGTFAIHLPLPVGDIHKLRASLDTDMTQTAPLTEFKLDGSYEAIESNKRYAIKSHYKNSTDIDSSARIEWGGDPKGNATQLDFKIKRDGFRHAIVASALTPYYLDEETLKADVIYGMADIYHVVSSSLYIPASEKVTEADVAFAGLSNMKGMINSTTPFLNVTWLRADFDFNTSE